MESFIRPHGINCTKYAFRLRKHALMVMPFAKLRHLMYSRFQTPPRRREPLPTTTIMGQFSEHGNNKEVCRRRSRAARQVLPAARATALPEEREWRVRTNLRKQPPKHHGRLHCLWHECHLGLYLRSGASTAICFIVDFWPFDIYKPEVFAPYVNRHKQPVAHMYPSG